MGEEFVLGVGTTAGFELQAGQILEAETAIDVVFGAGEPRA